MKQVSKSLYLQYLKCPKMMWYNTHGFIKQISENTQRTLDNGIEFGIMAQNFFGDVVIVDRDSNLPMEEQTKQYIQQGCSNIAEATFISKGGYCQVDILHKNENNMYDIVEVKSTSMLKPHYLDDIAFQYYVIKDILPIEHCYILHLNNEYRRKGPLTNDLFILEDVTTKAIEKLKPKLKKTKSKNDPIIDPNTDLIGNAIQDIFSIIDGPLPNIRIHDKCDDQWECPFMNDCISCLNETEKQLFSCEDLTWKQRINCLEKGEMIYPKGKEVLMMKDDEIIFDQEKVKSFLDTLSFPIYFLDFEAIQNIVPQYDNQKPWQQTPFQYSLHIMNSIEDTKLEHREFLWTESSDPRDALVKQLIEDIPMNACVIAYNMAFEKGIIKDLAEIYPQYQEHLMNIYNRCIDLMVPFKNKYYYKGDMRASYSIKKVLPSCYPNDPSLDYHNLIDVQNGTMAQEKYLELIKMCPSKEKDELIHNMLKYCELDTFAMYKVLLFLYDLVK